MKIPVPKDHPYYMSPTGSDDEENGKDNHNKDCKKIHHGGTKNVTFWDENPEHCHSKHHISYNPFEKVVDKMVESHLSPHKKLLSFKSKINYQSKS